MTELHPTDHEDVVREFLMHHAKCVPENFLARYDGADGPLTHYASAGQPIDVDRIQMFRCADDLFDQKKMSYAGALRAAMAKYPNVRPSAQSDEDYDQAFETLQREYSRYRNNRHGLLESDQVYVVDNFWHCVGEKNWRLAAAVFGRLSANTRAEICALINVFVVKHDD